VFSVASIITPLFIGIVVGALASGRVGATSSLRVDHTFADEFVKPWLAPFPVSVGLFALASFAFLAAVYLAYGAADVDLREDFRLRALASAGVVFVMAATALAVASRDARNVALGITLTPIGIAVQMVVATCAITAIVGLARRRYHLARVAAAGQIATIVVGWALAQCPYVVPDTLDVHAAAAPHATQTLLMIGLIAGTVVLVPSLRYLYRLFARAHAH
jgi:cytochrome d ubiquinol oxidase subunit II